MKTQQREPEAEMLPEYDFSGKKGVRGKYHRAYQQGHMVRIHEEENEILIRIISSRKATAAERKVYDDPTE